MISNRHSPDSAELTEEICRLDNAVMNMHFTESSGATLQSAQIETLLREMAKLCVRVRTLEHAILKQ